LLLVEREPRLNYPLIYRQRWPGKKKNGDTLTRNLTGPDPESNLTFGSSRWRVEPIFFDFPIKSLAVDSKKTSRFVLVAMAFA